MRGCLFSAPGEGFERSFSRGSAVRSANKMFPRVSYSGSCGVGGTHAQAQIRRKKVRADTDGRRHGQRINGFRAQARFL